MLLVARSRSHQPYRVAAQIYARQTTFKGVRSYATNPPPVVATPLRAPAGDAIDTTQSPIVTKKPRRTGLRFTLATLVLVLGFYGGSLYGSQVSERYRDFFVTEVPGGDTLVHAWEERNGVDKDIVKKLSEKARAGQGKAAQTIKQREERLKDFARIQEEKAKSKAKELKEQVKDGAEKLQQSVEANTQTVKQKVDQVNTAVADKAKEAVATAKTVVNQATSKAEATAQKAKEAPPKAVPTPAAPVSQVLPRETVPVDYQRPRQLDASPQPPKVAPTQPYVEPLPLGFEPPPGYSVPRAAPAAAESKAKPVKIAPPPLPLVAPAVSDLSASEPVLGQLAGTIDSLAKYLNDSPAAVGEKGARDVLSTATLDLKSLGSRLSQIKEEEKVKLEKVLSEKTAEYNKNLLKSERELVERLEKQEGEWKSLFDSERKEMIQGYRQKLDSELSVQKELIEQRLKEEVIAQGIELQKKWLSEVKNRVETERSGRLSKIKDLQEGLQSLEKTSLDSAQWLDENRNINKLWTAIRTAWKASVDNDVPGSRPAAFQNELQALANVAKSSDKEDAAVIEQVLSSIPASVSTQGVDNFSTISTWFTSRLSPKLLKASFFPQNGGFISYLSSSFLSLFLFKNVGFVQGNDVVSILSRTEYYLLNRDLDSAVREINQLTGWPKILSKQWLEAARRHLEVRQALQIAEAEAGLKSLLIL